MGIPRTTIIAALAFSIGICSIVLGQQDDQPWRRKPRAQPNPPATPKKTLPRRVILTPTTGSLSVAAKSGATILVEPLTIKRQGQQGTVPNGEGQFIFNDLKPGSYRVSGSLSGHESVPKEVTVKANKFHALTLDFQLIRYPITINTNINTGELRYGPQGQPLTNVVAIRNSTVQLNLLPGTYVVEIAAGEFGYELRRETFSVNGEQAREIKLNRIVLSSTTLSPSWTSTELKGWDLPSSWQADSKKKLLVKGKGIALPREPGFRYYKDFCLESNLKLNNKSAASFVLRARDPRNYYLLQLTSENSDEPHYVRLYVVKNGVERRIQAIPIPRSRMGSGFFSVSIKVIGYEIAVEITDSRTGEAYPLGKLTDSDHNFEYGAVGLAVRDNEEYEIERFVVCSTGPQCLNE